MRKMPTIDNRWDESVNWLSPVQDASEAGGAGGTPSTFTATASHEEFPPPSNVWPGDEKDFAKTFKGNGGGWFVIFVAPEPPPIPKNVE